MWEEEILRTEVHALSIGRALFISQVLRRKQDHKNVHHVPFRMGNLSDIRG